MDVPPILVETFERLDRPARARLGRQLRSAGLSYREIERLTGTPKSTVATWCRDITLAPAQRDAIRRRTGSRKGEPRDTQWKRRREIEQIRQEARLRAATLVDDPFWTAGVALYWGEGAKTQRRLEMSNADPAVLRVLKTWVLRYLDPDAEFRAALNLHEGNDPDAALTYWARELGMDTGAFYKHFVKPEGTGHRKNTLPYGVCRLRVRASTDAWITTMAWVEEVANRFGRADAPG